MDGAPKRGASGGTVMNEVTQMPIVADLNGAAAGQGVGAVLLVPSVPETSVATTRIP